MVETLSRSVSVVIPVYNAQGMIKDSIDQIIDRIDPLKADYEILLRDDGSTDKSKEVLERVALQYPEVRCFYNVSNEGLGSTLRRLWKDARGERVIYCDCDLPFEADVIPALLEKLQTSDIVVASRYCGALNRTPFVRKIFSRLYYFLCKALFNIPVMDIGSGSMAVRRQVLENLDLRAKGFEIHAELYIKASRKGFRIEEIPVKFFVTKSIQDIV